MSHVEVRMKETGEVRRVPDYVAEHLLSRKRAVLHIAAVVETAMQSPAADPQVERAVTPADDPQPRTARRRR